MAAPDAGDGRGGCGDKGGAVSWQAMKTAPLRRRRKYRAIETAPMRRCRSAHGTEMVPTGQRRCRWQRMELRAEATGRQSEAIGGGQHRARTALLRPLSWWQQQSRWGGKTFWKTLGGDQV